MNDAPVNLPIEQLRVLIGRRVTHDGVECEIVEILEDGPALILQECAQHVEIQPDQHGEAHRHVPVTRIVPVLDPEKTTYSATYLHLEFASAEPATKR